MVFNRIISYNMVGNREVTDAKGRFHMSDRTTGKLEDTDNQTCPGNQHEQHDMRHTRFTKQRHALRSVTVGATVIALSFGAVPAQAFATEASGMSTDAGGGTSGTSQGSSGQAASSSTTGGDSSSGQTSTSGTGSTGTGSGSGSSQTGGSASTSGTTGTTSGTDTQAGSNAGSGTEVQTNPSGTTPGASTQSNLTDSNTPSGSGDSTPGTTPQTSPTTGTGTLGISGDTEVLGTGETTPNGTPSATVVTTSPDVDTANPAGGIAINDARPTNSRLLSTSGPTLLTSSPSATNANANTTGISNNAPVTNDSQDGTQGNDPSTSNGTQQASNVLTDANGADAQQNALKTTSTNDTPTEGAQDTGDTPRVTKPTTASSPTEGMTLHTQTESAVSYDYNATLYNPTNTEGGAYAGVYSTKIQENQNDVADSSWADAQTIGMPSIADANLADAPTTESPAIISGAAVGYETRDMSVVDVNKEKERDAPYSYFPYSVVQETAADGSIHKKATGFDQTYVIARIDLSDYLNKAAGGFSASNSYLHVQQDDNFALLSAIGQVTSTGVATLVENFTTTTNSAQVVRKTGSYRLDQLFDTLGVDTTTPYLDVIMFATASNVAGADAGKADAKTGDIKLKMYVDNIADYNPNLKYDPTLQSTDPNYKENCLKKYFDYDEAQKKAAEGVLSKVSSYLIKGSDLALETQVENSDATGTKPTYWSLKKAIEKPYYDQQIDKSATDKGSGRTVKLMSEVAIIDGLELKGQPNALKKRTLDVNSFDVQVAKNTAANTSDRPASITMDNAWLTIADYSNTTGAELAIGNNAQLLIKRGGKLIIDKTCQLEVEWDGATTAPGGATDTLNNGLISLEAGGELQNDGILTIEGTEGKPYQENTKDQVVNSEKGFGEFTVSQGATLTNNGTIMVYGKLYNLGTIVNNGRFVDTIVSNDPDKGQFAYHKGIIASWKDDVTQQNVVYGSIINGQDGNGNTNTRALIINNGDIVLVPGELINDATITMGSGAHIYECTATEAIIPIEPTLEAPLVESKRITLDPPQDSKIVNNGTIVLAHDADMLPATIAILDNTGLGDLTLLEGSQLTLENNGRIVRLPKPPKYNRNISGNSDSSNNMHSSDDWKRTDTPSIPSRIPSSVPIWSDVAGIPWYVDGLFVSVPTFERLDDGVWNVTGMPGVDLRTILDHMRQEGSNELANELENGTQALWWCATIDDDTVRIMDLEGNLAPNVISVQWIAGDAPGEGKLVITFSDGLIVCFDSFADLFLMPFAL